jgi:hypothetical protein
MAKNSISYSFQDVVAALVGPGGVVSFGNGSGATEEGIQIDPTGEINTMTIGADGYGQHALSADRSGKVTVKLLKTSPFNAVLMALYNFQTASAGSHGQNTITIADKQRGDTITCQQCAFVKAPQLGYGKDALALEWVFDVIRIDRTIGTGI